MLGILIYDINKKNFERNIVLFLLSLEFINNLFFIFMDFKVCIFFFMLLMVLIFFLVLDFKFFGN